MTDPLGESRRWLAQARRDLADAEYCASGDRHNVACFLSQQAAEKALKAWLYAQGEPVVWGHSVNELAERAARSDADFGPLRDRVLRLDRFYIPTRYPNGLPGGLPADSFDASDSTQALELARETIEFVAGRTDL